VAAPTPWTQTRRLEETRGASGTRRQPATVPSSKECSTVPWRAPPLASWSAKRGARAARPARSSARGGRRDAGRDRRKTVPDAWGFSPPPPNVETASSTGGSAPRRSCEAGSAGKPWAWRRAVAASPRRRRGSGDSRSAANGPRTAWGVRRPSARRGPASASKRKDLAPEGATRRAGELARQHELHQLQGPDRSGGPPADIGNGSGPAARDAGRQAVRASAQLASRGGKPALKRRKLGAWWAHGPSQVVASPRRPGPRCRRRRAATSQL
jgi:hypothetical protein